MLMHSVRSRVDDFFAGSDLGLVTADIGYTHFDIQHRLDYFADDVRCSERFQAPSISRHVMIYLVIDLVSVVKEVTF